MRENIPLSKSLPPLAVIAIVTIPTFFYVKAHPIPGEILSPIIGIGIVLLFLSIVPLVIYADKVRTRFWQEVALSFGWNYEKAPKFESPGAIMFRQGRSRQARHVLTGEFEGLPLRMYQYQFTEGHGKSSVTWSYSVFEFTFKGTFPHFYLNYLNNFNPLMLGKHVRIRLPAEAEKKFALYAPNQYEIEALEVFTSDTVAFLLDAEWKYDVEMLDSTMIVFGQLIPSSAETLLKELEKMTKLLGHFSHKLDRASFAPIGDNPHRL